MREYCNDKVQETNLHHHSGSNGERIRFLEDELYERAYKDIEKLEAQNDFLKGLCNNQLEIIMDYEWKQMQEQAEFIKANTRKWRARCG